MARMCSLAWLGRGPEGWDLCHTGRRLIWVSAEDGDLAHVNVCAKRPHNAAPYFLSRRAIQLGHFRICTT